MPECLFCEQPAGSRDHERCAWVQPQEKDSKEHEIPCHHKLKDSLDEYTKAAGIAGDGDGPLLRTTGCSTGTPHSITQQDGHLMIERRARQAAIKARTANHSLREPGIIDYLKSDGRRGDSALLGDHEKVGI